MAFEMARQLINQNEQVEVLLLFNTYNSPTFGEEEKQEKNIEKFLVKQNVQPGTRDWVDLKFEVTNNEKISIEYCKKLNTYDGKVILFKPIEGRLLDLSNELLDDKFNGWANNAKIDLSYIPGDHYTIFNNPKAGALFNILNEILK